MISCARNLEATILSAGVYRLGINFGNSYSVLPVVVPGQPIVEAIIIGLIGDEDVSSKFQASGTIEGPGRYVDYCPLVFLPE